MVIPFGFWRKLYGIAMGKTNHHSSIAENQISTVPNSDGWFLEITDPKQIIFAIMPHWDHKIPSLHIKPRRKKRIEIWELSQLRETNILSSSLSCFVPKRILSFRNIYMI